MTRHVRIRVPVSGGRFDPHRLIRLAVLGIRPGSWNHAGHLHHVRQCENLPDGCGSPTWCCGPLLRERDQVPAAAKGLAGARDGAICAARDFLFILRMWPARSGRTQV
jgi:hypothetical protein